MKQVSNASVNIKVSNNCIKDNNALFERLVTLR